mmetsp:Transcript_1556/g.2226  ORF Transcript_1556/g.2226 Transcript_1556/m.2226 type:complete len:366 (-) Transcript_1556:766-1863(-)|eukprot:CAMPEP_0184856488 /NCGR_PEP_ID=MMETSP0580-20130426/1671_1 /TAXON_ID=1118495 /ORGANISM="Dactyliosolen fragilissimus" /LENGTH=365 /DNA_ID=CAMNT_0027351553 /DNA_START=27 /DNA_END=1124 /DNA_ORIENTATION=-
MNGTTEAKPNGILSQPPESTFDLPNLTCDPETWKNQPLVSVKQISSPGGLRLLHATALSMRDLVRDQGGDDRLKHRVLASIFYEPSTRTSCSFQTAMLRLGGKYLHVDASSKSGSSTKKGETLADTVRCLECYADVTVLRHPQTGSVGQVASVPSRARGIINAGDGVGEHPTQALLDLFTIVDELRLLDENQDQDERVVQNPLTIVMLGDLKNGRTVHSLAKLLARAARLYIRRPILLRYCSPSGLEMPFYVREYVSYIAGSTIIQQDISDIMQAINGANVLYVTRIQKERFEDLNEYEAVKGAYVVDAKLMKVAPRNMVVLHPLPRVDEISTEVDTDQRAAYFRQMENGMYVRMAILALILGKP